MSQGVFLTGATGFLGTEITTELIHRTNANIYVLVYAREEEEAVRCLKAAWFDQKQLCRHIGGRIIPIPGDITYYDLRLNKKNRETLISETGWIIHAASENDRTKEWGDIFSINLDGTQFILKLAKEIQADHELKKITYISSAYVSGKRTGVIFEKEELPEEFSDYCEESMAEAEKNVRSSGLPYAICRPSLMVGNSRTGKVHTFHALYEIILLLFTRPIPVLPIAPRQKLNFVPVDYVADAVVRLNFDPLAREMAFHLTSPDVQAPCAEEFLSYLRKWAARELKLPIYAVCFPMPFLRDLGYRLNERQEEKENTRKNRLLSMAPYFYSEANYDRSNADKYLEKYDRDWQEYFPVLLSYACRKNFIHQTEKTVFEQAMLRREDRKNPIYYHNITKYGVEYLSGPEMNEKIRTYACALEKHGIRSGCKVALTGWNSTDYMALETAIGLLGGISIPIDCRASLEELQTILQKSEAGWLFLGDEELLRYRKKLPEALRIVTYLEIEDEEADCTDILTREQFLTEEDSTYSVYQTPPDALATIRYTFDATGEAHGIMFRYGQLRWMGEIMAGILPWKKRKKPLRYLSFLPFSNEIEGLMTAYLPYYMQSNIDYYYLNDPTTLQETLPEVCPTLFFAPPEIYETMWQQLMETFPGKEYQEARGSLSKKILGKILKQLFLRKNGLHRCRQLLIGGPIVRRELLEAYRGIGIELYQLYGQPEAPMITLNRLGDNMIPSIGTVLPDTEIQIKEDRELIVRGPQVSPGYYHEEAENLKNGNLKTGACGGIGKNKHVFITNPKPNRKN